MRKDGIRIKDIDNSHAFYTFLMPKRIPSTIFIPFCVDAKPMNELINEYNEKGVELTVFHVVVSALLKTGMKHPDLNRFIYRHKFYQRLSYQVSFAVGVGEETVFRKLDFKNELSLLEVSKIILDEVREARKGAKIDLDSTVDLFMKFPTWLTKFITTIYPYLFDIGLFPRKFADDDILFTSAMVSNLGTFGVGAPYHHLYEWGSSSVFLTIGGITKKPVVVENQIVIGERLDFVFSVDERVSKGKALTEALKYFTYLLENPRSMI
jgi:pyruvate/2-oxoglutarate dehydrogenase complex dihydrolipoamide acyltransferase (E2) component